MAKPKRERTARREVERAFRGMVRDKERMWKLDVGGSPERPIVVESAAVIETRAGLTPCLQCGGELDMVEHVSRTLESGARRRLVSLRCRQCGAPREMWFTIEVVPEFS